jgi:predicted glycoside hydrolase/deacetylase ChbG (UPF0249 family)
MKPNPVLKKLGFADDDRVVLIHCDDIGMCQAGVEAFSELSEVGVVSTAAIMVPCPWFLEAAKFAVAHPQADLGVHLTLTSEWQTYRWGPLSTRDPASGLIDEEGYFYHRSEMVQEHGSPEAVKKELVAQMERALAAGIEPTHADTHMGSVAHLKFMESYIKLALEYKVPPMMLRLDEEGWRMVNESSANSTMDETAITMAARMVTTLEQIGVPLLDNISGLPLDSDPRIRMEQARSALSSLPAGLTHFIIHPAKDTPELRAITPDWACRVADYKTFLDKSLGAFLKNKGIHVIGYRAIKELMAG